MYSYVHLSAALKHLLSACFVGMYKGAYLVCVWGYFFNGKSPMGLYMQPLLRGLGYIGGEASLCTPFSA